MAVLIAKAATAMNAQVSNERAVMALAFRAAQCPPSQGLYTKRIRPDAESLRQERQRYRLK